MEDIEIKTVDFGGEKITVEIWTDIERVNGHVTSFTVNAQNILVRGVIGEGLSDDEAIEDLKNKLTSEI